MCSSGRREDDGIRERKEKGRIGVTYLCIL